MYGVVMRYAFNNAPAYVEQASLLLVISVAMFAASAGVRDATHIGMDSLVAVLPPPARFVARVLVQILTIHFAFALAVGGAELAISLHGDTIPTLGISSRSATCQWSSPASPSRSSRSSTSWRSGPERKWSARGTDGPVRELRCLPAAGRSRCHRPGPRLHRNIPGRGLAVRDGHPDDDLGNERVLVPRDPLLHLLRRTHAARRNRRQDRGPSREASWATGKAAWGSRTSWHRRSSVACQDLPWPTRPPWAA